MLISHNLTQDQPKTANKLQINSHDIAVNELTEQCK